MENPPEKTHDQLLDDYIMGRYMYPGDETPEFRKDVADSREFAYFKVDYFAARLGNTMIGSLSIRVDKAKRAFNRLAKQLKDLK